MRRQTIVGVSTLIVGLAAVAILAGPTGWFSSVGGPASAGSGPQQTSDVTADADALSARDGDQASGRSDTGTADAETAAFPTNYEECVAAGGRTEETHRDGVVECVARTSYKSREKTAAFKACKDQGGGTVVGGGPTTGTTYTCTLRFTKRVEPPPETMPDEEARRLLSKLRAGGPGKMRAIQRIAERTRKDDGFGRMLRSTLADGDVRARRGAARLLAHYHRPSSLDFDADTLDALEAALDDPDAQVRQHAALTLIEVHERHPDDLDVTRERLVDVAAGLLRADDKDVRRASVKAFRRLEVSGFADQLLEVAREDDVEYVRRRAWLAVADLGTREHLEPLREALREPPLPHSDAVGYALETLGGDDFPRIACRWMTADEPDPMRERVAHAIGNQEPFGKHFNLRDHRDVCGELGIDLEPLPDDE